MPTKLIVELQFENLPEELIFAVFKYISLRDIKSISVTCRRLYGVAVREIWKSPTLKCSTNIQDLVHLPIQVLHLKDLRYNFFTFILVDKNIISRRIKLDMNREKVCTRFFQVIVIQENRYKLSI